MNVVFNDIQDRMDRQDAVIASLQEEVPKEPLMLEARKACLRQGEKGVVEVSEELQDGMMGLIET
ncbi:hypothetical protein CK203_044322 [Vitis vinifera]|uniref:Uncharacterized protein n=1 Tax=Vitis vinifera TaxID=29760 RepID=A0A438H839_VITVI|nr:hypothetical protein CK203_044322 [Vitis vinifera]